jgi:hypothetical protein
VRNRLARVAVIAVSVAGLTACTTTAVGNPVPDQVNSTENPTSESPSSGGSTSEDPPSDDDLPSDGAPKVENPIDASHFEQNPCDALTSEQANRLNVDPTGRSSETSQGPSCHWRNPETGGATAMGFLSTTKRGLSETYRSHKNGDFKYFKPIPDLEGFPAVAFDTQSSSPTTSCSVTVGVSDELSFQTLTELSAANIGQRDPCEVAEMATREMAKTIREGS